MAKIKNLPKTCSAANTKRFVGVIKRFRRTCSVCGRRIRVVLYKNRQYCGGHFFGRIPVYNKKEEARLAKIKTKPFKFGRVTLYVFTHDIRPKQLVEYWECEECCWGC